VINFSADESFGLVDLRQRGPECGRAVCKTATASGNIQVRVMLIVVRL